MIRTQMKFSENPWQTSFNALGTSCGLKYRTFLNARDLYVSMLARIQPFRAATGINGIWWILTVPNLFKFKDLRASSGTV